MMTGEQWSYAFAYAAENDLPRRCSSKDCADLAALLAPEEEKPWGRGRCVQWLWENGFGIEWGPDGLGTDHEPRLKIRIPRRDLYLPGQYCLRGRSAYWDNDLRRAVREACGPDYLGYPVPDGAKEPAPEVELCGPLHTLDEAGLWELAARFAPTQTWNIQVGPGPLTQNWRCGYKYADGAAQWTFWQGTRREALLAALADLASRTQQLRGDPDWHERGAETYIALPPILTVTAPAPDPETAKLDPEVEWSDPVGTLAIGQSQDLAAKFGFRLAASSAHMIADHGVPGTTHAIRGHPAIYVEHTGMYQVITGTGPWVRVQGSPDEEEAYRKVLRVLPGIVWDSTTDRIRCSPKSEEVPDDAQTDT